MGKGTFIGIIAAFAALFIGFAMDGGNIVSVFLLSPAIIVIGGTFGALITSCSMNDVKRIPKLVKTAGEEPHVNFQDTLDTLVNFTTIVKKEGLLALEKIVNDQEFIKAHDPLIIKGVELLMENTEKDVMREILENDVYVFEELKRREIGMFESAGGFSPTMGVIGTVLGLVNVLANMGSPEELAASIATAFVATFYGVALANLLYLPIANKLKLQLSLYLEEKGMIIDGLLAIHDFENPSTIKGRLSVYLKFAEGSKKASSSDKKVQEAELSHEQAK